MKNSDQMESREERRARLAALREGASRKRTAASDPAELFEETVEERDEEIEEVEDARGEKR